MPLPVNKRKQREKRLVELFSTLAKEQQETLLEFAQFLASRNPAPVTPRKPVPLPRPETESVVAAIKRLTAGYPMLDKGPLLNETSGLMTQHVMQGHKASEVIDELEQLFLRHYQEWKQSQVTN